MMALGTSRIADEPLLSHSSPICCSSGGAGDDCQFGGSRSRSRFMTNASLNVQGIRTYAGKMLESTCTRISSAASAAFAATYTTGRPGEFHRPPSTLAPSPSKAVVACLAFVIRQAVIIYENTPCSRRPMSASTSRDPASVCASSSGTAPPRPRCGVLNQLDAASTLPSNNASAFP